MTDKTVRLPVGISVFPYLQDHRFEGQAVFPAVEAMQVLAQSVNGHLPHADISAITEARFDKFLYIQTGASQIAAFCNVTIYENGDITAVLQSKNKSGSTSITRSKDHVTLRFPRKRPVFPDFSTDAASVGDRIYEQITPVQIYRDLVPFGPAYHNIAENLNLHKDGAIAKLRAPIISDAIEKTGQLGSPFVLDAAFHAACVWGQRYRAVVA